MWYCQVKRHRSVRAVSSSGVLRDVPSQLGFQDIAVSRHERVNPLCLRVFFFLISESRGKETDKHIVYVWGFFLYIFNQNLFQMVVSVYLALRGSHRRGGELPEPHP